MTEQVAQVAIKVTRNVRNHKVNDEYPCLLITLKPLKGTHIEFESFMPPTVEWMIRDKEAFEIFTAMCKRSLTFLFLCREYLLNME